MPLLCQIGASYDEEGTKGVERDHVELVGFESSCHGKLRPSVEIDIYPTHPKPILTGNSNKKIEI